MGITQAKTLGIQGLGGVGKSTLAAYFYQSLDFEAKFWADVSLKPDFTVFAENIILALGGKVTQPIDITELTNNLLKLLSERRCLLVVDNLETLLNEERNWQEKYYQDFFSRWKQQGTNSTLFITTQEKPQLFQGLDYWHTLGGMKIEEGITLLDKLAIQGTEAELTAFVEYVDGHPLTIKLVAGYLKEYGDSQLNQVTKLGLEQFDLTYKEAKGLHRNKQDARLSWIIQQHLARLTLEQIEFLINLSVYRLPFNREGASYQWIGKEVKPIVIQKKLQELCNRSLLIKTQDNKFQFESLVQKYVLQQANDLTNAHQNAVNYYLLNLKSKPWKSFESITEYIEAFYQWCELKQYILAKDILNYCCDFLNLGGYYAVLVEVYEKLRSGWQENLQSEEQLDYYNSLNNLANAYYFQGEYSQAIDFYQQSLDIVKQIRDVNRVAISLNNLANAYDLLGEYSQAIDFYQQSLDIAQQIGDVNLIANSFNNLGSSYYFQGEYQQAIEFSQKSYNFFRKIGDVNGMANSLGNLGLSYSSLGEYQQAIEFSQKSYNFFRKIGYINGMANSLSNLGIGHYFLRDYSQAIDFYQQSLDITQQIGDRNGQANTWFNLGLVYEKLNQKPEAKTAYENANKLFQAIRLDKKVKECNKAIQDLENDDND